MLGVSLLLEVSQFVDVLNCFVDFLSFYFHICFAEFIFALISQKPKEILRQHTGNVRKTKEMRETQFCYLSLRHLQDWGQPDICCPPKPRGGQADLYALEPAHFATIHFMPPPQPPSTASARSTPWRGCQGTWPVKSFRGGTVEGLYTPGGANQGSNPNSRGRDFRGSIYFI